jgi:hypothetical protein
MEDGRELKNKHTTRLMVLLWALMVVLSQLPVGASASNPIGLSLTASPSQSLVVKPVDKPAEASIDLNLKPSGTYESLNRKPMDVIFIFDTSGSMNESGRKPQKLKSAKDAMTSAINYFKANSGPNDRFAFIPFSTAVDTSKVVTLTQSANPETNLTNIQGVVNGLNAVGGTNYKDPIEYAKTLFGNSTNDKNMIFMTDGHIMTSKEKVRQTVCTEWLWWGNCRETEKEIVERNVHFTANSVFYEQDGYQYNASEILIGSKWKATNSPSNRQDLLAYIKERAKTAAQELGKQEIKMYSIGFGDNQAELDYTYLQQLSSVTGGFSSKASEGNVSDVFLKISETIAAQKVDAEISIDLSSFDSKVTVADNANAAVDGTMVKLRQSFDYEYKKEAPAPVDLSLPLLFNESGTYTFNNITMTYKRPDGSTAAYTHTPITIKVDSEAPPTIKGVMTLQGETNAVNNLIKQSGSRGNYFYVNYELTPDGLSSSFVAGRIQNIVIVQPLPEGVSIEPSSGITVRTSNSVQEAVISVNQAVVYSGGIFTPSSFSASLKLKADWALTNVTMPKATIEFKETRFNQTYQNSISASSERINNKVRLLEYSNTAYDGYANGIIRKADLSNNMTIAETEFPNDYGLQTKPVKELIYAPDSQGKAILITYSDESTAIAYFTADAEMTGASSGKFITNDTTVQEDVNVKLSQFVAGKGVKYYYRVNDQTEWTGFEKGDTITLNTPGENTIKIKSSGGFSFSDHLITKTVTIEKKVEQIVVKAMGDDPSKITVLENNFAGFTVEIFPKEATNKNWTYEIIDENVAGKADQTDTGGRVKGIEKGSTKLIATSVSNPEVKAEIPVVVVTDFVELEGVKFGQAKYTNIEQSDVESLIEYTPADATNPVIVSVEATKGDIVDIQGGNGEYTIDTIDGATGYTTVTVTAEQIKTGNDGTETKITKKDSAVFQSGDGSITVDPNDGEGKNENIEGRW